MKYTIGFSIVILFASSCRKNLGECKDYKEISGQEHSINVNAANTPELADTLAKYPQLQLYRLESDNIGWTATCHVFYKGLIIFSDVYNLYKDYATNTVSTFDAIVKNPGIQLQPSVSASDAVKEAKKNINFDYECISYRLGLFNVNAQYGVAAKNYRLVWKIQKSGSDYPFALIDALNKQVIQTSGGSFDY